MPNGIPFAVSAINSLNDQISISSSVPKSECSDDLTIIAYCISDIVRQRISPFFGQFELMIRTYLSESDEALVVRI